MVFRLQSKVFRQNVVFGAKMKLFPKDAFCKVLGTPGTVLCMIVTVLYVLVDKATGLNAVLTESYAVLTESYTVRAESYTVRAES